MSNLPDGDDAARVRIDKTRVLAAVSTLAAERGIRILAVGGPVFAAQGLISPRLSRSASVIVDMVVFEDFIAALTASGWVVSAPVKRLAVLPSVVLVLTNTEWVVRLDVYTVFPGFYIDPKRVFAILWARRQVLTLNGTRIFTLDRLSMVMMAVHDRLGPQSWKTSEHNYDRYLIDQFRRTLNDHERKELFDLVRALCAVEPMRPLLEALDIDGGEVTLPTEIYARWRLSISSATPATLMMLGLAECSPQRRLRQGIQVFRQSPGTMFRAVMASPKAFWLICTARHRMRAQHRNILASHAARVRSP